MTAGAEVRGRASGGNSAVEAARVISSSKSGYYTAFSGSVSNGASDTAMTSLTGGSDFFTPLPDSKANFIEIYSNADIKIKVRTLQNAGTAIGALKQITIRSNVTKTIDYIAEITQIYFSNTSGGAASIDIVAI